MHVYPRLTNKYLIFAGERLKDVSMTPGNVYLPPPDQQRLVFHGKRLEDTSKAQGMLTNNASSSPANSLRMCPQLRGMHVYYGYSF